jgi:hypothetical protein
MPMSSGFDTCIQTSHHGPSMFWLAKVDDAATANATALDWFKISEDGLIAPGELNFGYRLHGSRLTSLRKLGD